MNRDPSQDAERILDDWASGRAPLERPSAREEADPLLALLVEAQRAQPQLRDDESAQVLTAVRNELRRPPRRRALLPWAAAAAVLLAVVAAWPRRHPAPERTVVQRMLFEAEHQGRVVRLELIVSRIEAKKGDRHVAKPSL